MTNLILTDPQSNQQIVTEICTEEYERQQAWRIKFPDGRSALVGIGQHGIWQQFDGNNLDSRLIINIGQAIEKQQST